MEEWSRNVSWRQGKLLQKEAIDALKLHSEDASEETIAIVASHDCDLAQDPSVEPNVELILGRLIEKDGNFTHAKNPRKLHIGFVSGTPLWCEFEATKKISVDKVELFRFAPRNDAELTFESLSAFQMWLGSRYRRSAFADEFERRLTKDTKLAEKIAKAVKPHGELIVGIFFDVDDGEEVAREGADDTYGLDIIILHAADPDFNAAEKAAQKAAAEIKKAFEDKLYDPQKRWQQIELRSCESISESVLTYQLFKQLKRWRLEHISLASDPQQPVLAD